MSLFLKTLRCFQHHEDACESIAIGNVVGKFSTTFIDSDSDPDSECGVVPGRVSGKPEPAGDGATRRPGADSKFEIVESGCDEIPNS